MERRWKFAPLPDPRMAGSSSPFRLRRLRRACNAAAPGGASGCFRHPRSTGGSGTSGTGTDWQDGDTVGVKKFFTIPEGRAVWLKGYIVGCATGSKGNKYQTVPPFEYETAILIADSPQETDKDNTAAIQLKSSTTARKDLNLKTNPNLHGCKVIIFGAKTQYLKLHGIKTIFAYEIP